MSRRGFPTFLFGLLASLNGVVMLIGPGLHALPGCGHGAVVFRPDDRPDESPHVGAVVAVDHSTCPVCEFLAQGQVVAERASIPAPVASASPAAARPFATPELRLLRAFGCRAPPTLIRA